MTATGDAEERLRDLTRRLGFGDNITEPMADNDTIVAWFEQQSRDASEWQESQLWRNDCYAKGHPDDEDCWECDPSLRLIAAERAAATGDDLRDRVAALADEMVALEDPHDPNAAGVTRVWGRRLRDVLAAPPAPVVSRPEAVVKAEARREDAEALRQAERDGYLFLDAGERVPWESIARWLEHRAASLASDSKAGP